MIFEVSKLLSYSFQRIWNKDFEKQKEWKGSYPDWKFSKSGVMGLFSFLENRRREEGAEGLWRIHDKLYDLEKWIHKHPGGSSWITTTRGLDITEAFESFHVRGNAETFLPEYYVREATTSRNSPFTFHEGGFFKTLKKEVKLHLEHNKDPTLRLKSTFITDTLLIISLLLAAIGAKYMSIPYCILSGITLCFVVICAHNYFHQKDNFRMYYFNLALLSFRDWRISHALSHHIFPNSRYDLEVTMFDPFLQWLPYSDKTFVSRYLSWIYSPIAYSSIFYKQCIERLLTNPDGWLEIIPLVYPAVMVLWGGANLWDALLMWQVILLSGSFLFGLIGLNAGHHHPDIFHDGDVARDDRDWGLYQLDAVRDRLEIKGRLPLIMITFGDHSLHHLFPTLDHAELDALHPILIKLCKRFKFDLNYSNQMELMKGQFKQLARIESKNNQQILK